MHRGAASKVAGLVAIALLASCTGSGTPSGTPLLTPSPGPVATATASPAPTVPPPSAAADDIDRIIEFATGGDTPGLGDLGRLWNEAFTEIEVTGQSRYQAPTAIISYRAGEVPATACSAGTSASDWANNAKYCPADRSIAYDETWLRDAAGRFSYFAPVTILAHEWGHHVQTFIGRGAKPIQEELEADCFAGLYTTASRLLPRGEPNSEEQFAAAETAMRNWFDLGDESYLDAEWFAAGHGSSQQRIMAFSTGFMGNIDFQNPDPAITGGIPWCLGYEDFQAGAYVEIGPYAYLEMPGRPGTWAGQAFGIGPETRTTRPSSSIVMAWLPNLPQPGGATDAQLQALWAAGYPGLTPIGPVDLAGNVPFGTAAAWYYENRPPATPDAVESGIFALISPASGIGGLVIVVSRPEAAPVSLEDPGAVDTLEEEIGSVFQVLRRLCSPDDNATIGDEHFDVVCMRDQQ